MAVNGVGSGLGASMVGYARTGSVAGALTPEQEREVRRLKALDQKVKQHEQAHIAAGAGLTSGASFQYVRGPDGRQYAVGGEVRIETSGGATPEATLERARRIRAAALAPADPSPQDRAVAAAAALMESQARAEIRDSRQADSDEEAKMTPSERLDPGRRDGLRAYLGAMAESDRQSGVVIDTTA